VSAILAVGALTLGYTVVGKDPVGGFDEASSFILVVTTGYLLYDTLWLLSHFRSGDGQFLVHHVVTLVLYGYACTVRKKTILESYLMSDFLETIHSI
jgi:hypothetical protein